MKTLKLFIISILLFCFINPSYCQLKHEIKIEGLRAIFSNFIPSYEIILTKRIGIECEIGIDDWKMPLIDSINSDKKITYKQLTLSPSLGGKYYFLLNNYGNGIFIGPYSRFEYILKMDNGFYQHWETINNKPSPKYLNKGLSQILYGLQGGFKLLIKSHFILESDFFWLQERHYPEERTQFDTFYRFEFFIKLGYRF